MRIRKKAIALLFTAGLFLALGVATAQITELNQQFIDKRINSLTADSVSDDDEVLSRYRNVNAWLKKSAAYAKQVTNYEAAIAGSEKREAGIVARMAAMTDTAVATEADYAGIEYEVLKTQLVEKKSELGDLIGTRANIETQLAAREENARQIRSRLGEISIRLTELPELTLQIDPHAKPSLLEATRWETASELQALGTERRALTARLNSQPARYRIYRVEREELTQKIDRISLNIRVLEDLVATSGLSDAVALDDTGIIQGDPTFPIAEKLAATSVELKQQFDELISQLKTTLAHSDEVKTRTRNLNDSFATAQRIVDFAADSDILGNILLAYWHEIPTFEMVDVTDTISSSIGDTVINRIGHEKDRLALANSAGFVARQIDYADINPDLVTADVRDALINLTQSIRDRLTKIIALESEFIEAARGLDTGYRQLTQRVADYRAFLRGLILWVPSHPSVLELDFRGIPDEVAGLIRALRAVRVSTVGPGTIGWLLLATVLLLARRRLNEARAALNSKITRLSEDGIRFTVGAIGGSLLRALPLPLLLMAGSSLLASVTTPAGEALSSMLQNLVAISFALVLIQVLCEKSGVARVHFRWDETTCQRIETGVKWLIRWFLPVVGITLMLLSFEKETIDATLSRLMLLATLAMLTARMIRGLQRAPQRDGETAMVVEPQNVRWGILLVMSLLFFGVSSGHIYSVGLVIDSSVDTLWILIVLDLLYALLTRWLNIARRRLLLENLLASRTGAEDEESGIDETQVELGELSTATSQLLKMGIGTAGIVALVYIWSPLLPILNMLKKITFWTTSSLVDGQPVISPITLETLVIVLFIAVATFYAARKLPALVELVMRSRAGVTKGVYYTASTLLSYVIVGSGVIAIASALGLQWSQLQWLVAALSVGIGFGLQEIVANFFSGLIILFERPIRVGDVVTVGESEGLVTRIRIRATTIKDWDGKELLVPNKEFISGRLLNWTLSDPLIRITLNVGVAYGSDVERALSILDEITSNHADVLKEPPPSIIFQEFGDNALQLSARCFVRTFDDRWPVLTSLHRLVYARFEEAGIVISFPQRDVHLHAENPIRIELSPV
ncbi:MAG: hypothetical protein DRQ54_08455 [Gammaproteobacteria bacterium]|nr:MAG: hypothetical protein DRQ54_08455 [Gammaproteobacteria bacterium]